MSGLPFQAVTTRRSFQLCGIRRLFSAFFAFPAGIVDVRITVSGRGSAQAGMIAIRGQQVLAAMPQTFQQQLEFPAEL